MSAFPASGAYDTTALDASARPVGGSSAGALAGASSMAGMEKAGGVGGMSLSSLEKMLSCFIALDIPPSERKRPRWLGESGELWCTPELWAVAEDGVVDVGLPGGRLQGFARSL